MAKERKSKIFSKGKVSRRARIDPEQIVSASLGLGGENCVC